MSDDESEKGRELDRGKEETHMTSEQDDSHAIWEGPNASSQKQPVDTSSTGAAPGQQEFLAPPRQTDPEEESKATSSLSLRKVGNFARRFSPVLVPLPFAILIFLVSLPFVLRAQIVPLAVLLLALAVMQGTLLYYAGSNDTYWILWLIIGYALFIVVGTMFIFGLGAGLILLIVLLFIGIFMARRSIRQVPEGYADIVLVSGRYARTLYPGFNLKMPWEKVSNRLSTKEISWTCPEQLIKISRDQDVKLVATISYQLMPEDAHIAALNVDNWEESLKKQFVGTLLSVINELEPADIVNWPQGAHAQTSLDIGSIDAATITRWDRMNTLLANRIQDKAAKWGVQINSVRIQDITPIPHLASSGYPPAGMAAQPQQPQVMAETIENKQDSMQAQQPAYSPPPPANESLAQPSQGAESPVTRQEEALTIQFAIGKLNDYLLWFLMLLEVVLLIQFFLKLIGADPNNPFTAFMYALTFIPLFPFSNPQNSIVPNTPLGTNGVAAIDWSILIAMAVYFLAFYALRRFLYVLISRPEVSPGVNIVEASVIRSAINNSSYSNYQQLAKAIIHRIGATDERLLENTVWEILLPKIGLQLDTGKAILFLRIREENNTYYEHLLEEKSASGADFLLLVDYLNIGKPTLLIDSGIVWLKPDDLKEMVDTPRDEVKAWLGRLIASQLKNFEDLIPYQTHGPADHDMFFGRDYELQRLSSGAARGGIIIGAHQSGKTSLLKRLGERLEKQHYVVGGPYSIHSPNFQTFFYDTLRELNIGVPADISLESWSSMLRDRSIEGKHLVLLLDEVDTLLDQENAKTVHNLGREMRALQNDGYCKFYLAGHKHLREAIALEGGPFRNFAQEITLRGLDESPGIRLIQEPIRDIGFNVSAQQAERIFKGTAGVAVLIQGFCRRLLLKIHRSRDPNVPDSVIKIIEEDPDYLNMVFDYYEYAKTWDSMAVMLVTARLKESTRQDIIQLFSEYGVKLTWDRLDNILRFLTQFGILKEFEAGRYQVLSKYLCKAIEARSGNTDAFLVSQFEKGKRER